MAILGITPARAGSKGIHGKNIKQIAGKPLITWTIEAAKKTRALDRYIVSTDDPEIKKICEMTKTEVIDRPRHLSGDSVTTLEVLQDILRRMIYDVVVLLQCTSPVRSDTLIDECVQKFIDEKADSLATGFYHHYFEWGTYSSIRQELKPIFHDDGNVYVLRSKNIINGDLFGEKRVPFPIERIYNFEIDEPFEFELNEFFLNKIKRLKKKKL